MGNRSLRRKRPSQECQKVSPCLRYSRCLQQPGVLRGAIPRTNEDTEAQTGTAICLSQAAIKAQDGSEPAPVGLQRCLYINVKALQKLAISEKTPKLMEVAARKLTSECCPAASWMCGPGRSNFPPREQVASYAKPKE